MAVKAWAYFKEFLTLSSISYSHQVFSQVSVCSQIGNILGEKNHLKFTISLRLLATLRSYKILVAIQAL